MTTDRPCAQPPKSPIPTRRMVFDTNVVLDMLHFGNPAGLRLLDAVRRGEIVSIVSRASLAEAAIVLSRPAFGLSPESAGALAQEWASLSHLIPEDRIDAARSASPGLRCRDPEDEKFLHLSIAGQAEALVTRDKVLLKAARKLRRFGIEPATPESWLLSHDHPQKKS